MRLIIPQKQILNLRRHRFLEEDVSFHTQPKQFGIARETSDEKTAESLQERLLSIWRSEGLSEKLFAEIEKMTDLNLWKISKVDVALHHELFNLIDEIMEKLIDQLREKRLSNRDEVSMIDTSTTKVNNEKDQEVNSKINIVLKFLKAVIFYSTNFLYFNSSERIVDLYNIYHAENNLKMLEEILGVLLTLSSKQLTEKKPSALTGKKLGFDRFNEDISQIMKDIQQLIWSFSFLTDILCLPQSHKIDFQTIFDQSIQLHLTRIPSNHSEQNGNMSEQDLEIMKQVNELKRLKTIINDFQTLEDMVVILFRSINLYLSVGDLGIGKKKIEQNTQLETLLPPKVFINKMMQIFKMPHLNKRVHIFAMNILYCFIVLDLNTNFSYIPSVDNMYYAEACNHSELFINLLQRFAKYHSYQKLKDVYTDSGSSDVDMEIVQFLDHQKDLVNSDEDTEAEVVQESIKSQRFFNSFLHFLCNLLNFKNRQLQNLLFPQFLKPLLAIVNVRPTRGKLYPININCQLKAAKLLKEVVKMQSLDDPGAVERIVERLKEEIKYLQTEEKFYKMQDDDCESDITNVARQDLIRTFLRFLSYSIIRNDPNAINFTQNFVANSRKILDSDLIQNEMLENIFEPNRKLEDEKLITTIDPVILQCIQLISYLFNDLPQKIPAFIENQVFPRILKSLSIRLPIEADLIIILMKFIQTLCLNHEGQEIVVQSGIIKTFANLACNPLAHKQFINQNKVPIFTDMIQSVTNQSMQMADAFFKEVLKNFTIMVEKAWEVTQLYVEMETKIREDPLMTKDQQDVIRYKYEKHQVNLEVTFESCSNLLWFIIDNEGGMAGHTQRAIKLSEELASEVLEIVITTPIVASACSNMFPVFIETLIQIINIFGTEFEIKFMTKILGFIEIQLKNMELLLDTSNFDEVNDVEQQIKKINDLKVAEVEILSPQRQVILNNLKEQDLASVVFGKIAFYSEIIQKCVWETKQKLFKLTQFNQVISKLFKLQALINRYHAAKYEKDILKEVARLDQLKALHPQVIVDTDFTKFTPCKEPLDDQDELQNLYYKYEVEKIQSLTDQKARESFKTAIELHLEENISHTSNMCQQAIRKMIISYLRSFNRNKAIHFQESVDIQLMQFNQLIGDLIADEFLEFRKIQQRNISDTPPTETEVMKYCCQFSAVFSEFNKVLFGTYSFGAMLIQFLNRGGLQCIKEIILWIVKYIYNLERDPKPKSLNQCKNIQLLWSHLIDFFVQLLEGRYLEQQFQTFLVTFKQNPALSLKPPPGNAAAEENYKAEYEVANKRMKAYFIDIFADVLHFMFVELNECEWVMNFNGDKKLSVFEYFDQISELFLVSMIDIYSFISKGLQHNKFFSGSSQADLKNAQMFPKTSQQKEAEQLEKNVRDLIEMGFEELKIRNALRLSDNILEIAMEILITNNHPELSQPLPDKVSKEEPEKPQEEQKVPDNQQDTFKMNIKIGSLTKTNIYRTLSMSFGDYLKFNPTSQGKVVRKGEILENIFFRLGADKEDQEAIQQMLIDVKAQILHLISDQCISKDSNNVGILSLSLTNLLSYRHGQLINTKEVFEAIFEILAIYQLSMNNIKIQLSNKDENWDKKKEKILIENMRQIEQTIQLFMYITQEGKISSDLSKLESILNTSSLDDKYKDLETQLDQLIIRNTQNIFHQNKDQTAEIYQKITLSIIDLFKSLHYMNHQIAQTCEPSITELVIRGIEIMNFLMNIKSFPSFDCQSFFLQNDGIRALFGIKAICQDFSLPLKLLGTLESKKFVDIQIQSKILIQMLSQNDNTQIKVYENLIKSILFIYFQEKFKKEEGMDLRAFLINPDTNISVTKSDQQILQTQSKKKKGQQSQSLFSPLKKSKSEISQSKIKYQSILKKADYGEALLSDFIQFFNNVMEIQDFKSFLQACQNVCIIKKKISPKETESKKVKIVEEEEKVNQIDSRSSRAKRRRENKEKLEEEKKQKEVESETKANEEKYYIMMNPQAMKDMINQQDVQQNVQAEQEKKGSIQHFQQELIFSLLDQFIEQIRDQQMLILNHAKSKTNPSTLGLQSRLDNNGCLLLSPSENAPKSLSYQTYLFDYVALLGHLTYLITHTPILVRSLLKHKDGKTFKFIIRNIHFLYSLAIESHESLQIRVWLEYANQNKKRADAINEFFKRVMFDNPHLTQAERRAKQEARFIFQKEVLRNLTDHYGPQNGENSKYPQWPQLRTVYNLGALWLISIVLKDEERDEQQQQQSKQIESLVLNMQKYRNIYRHEMIKALIQETQKPQDNFTLFKVIQAIQRDILLNIKFFENQKEPIYICVQALTNLFRPFESNKAIWGNQLSLEENNQLSASELGFIQMSRNQEPLAELPLEEDEDDEEDDDEEELSDNSVSDDPDDDLNSQSERDFRFDRDEDEEEAINAQAEDDDESLDHDDQQRHRWRGREEREDEDMISYIDEDDDIDDNDSDGYGDEVVMAPEGLELLEDLINRVSQDIGIVQDFSNEEEEENSDDNEQEIEQEIADLIKQQENEGQNELQDQAAPQREEGQPNEEEQDDDDEYDEEADEEEDIEDYDSEEASYFDEDEIGDEDEVQIYVGRNPDQLERLSHIAANIQGGGPGNQRILDILSHHNLSVDFPNLGGRNGINQVPDDISASGQSESLDHENVGNNPLLNRNQMNRAQPPPLMFGAPQFNLQNDNFSFIRGDVRQPIGRQGGKSQPMPHQSKEDQAYKPVMTLLEIVALGKEMQRRDDIYKQYIKEIEQTSAQNQTEPIIQEVEKPERQQQQSKNPFAHLAAQPIVPPNTQEYFRQPMMINTSTNTFRQALQQDTHLDGLDPEFMENLDQTGLQNIADTENVINFIQQQQQTTRPEVLTTAQFLENITNRDERAQILRNMPDHTFNNLPPALFTEGLIYRRMGGGGPGQQNPPQQIQITIHRADGQQRVRTNSSGMGWPQMRSRLQSLDQQLNDITDFSIQPGDPYIRQSMMPVNTNRFISNFFAHGDQSSSNVQDNSILNSFQQYLQDQIVEMSIRPVLDAKGHDLTIACEQILNQALLSNIELNDQYYQRISGLIEMIMVWIKYLTNGLFILQKEAFLMRILLRIPYLREGLLISVLDWLVQGVSLLESHVKSQLTLQVDHQINVSNQFNKPFFIERGNGLPGTIDLKDFIVQCIRCMKHLVSSNNIQDKKPLMQAVELLKSPEQDNSLRIICQMIGKNTLDKKESIFGQVMKQLLIVLNNVKHRPSLLGGSYLELADTIDKDNEQRWDLLLSSFQLLLRQVSEAYTKNPSNIQLSLDHSTIEQFCHLLLTTEFKIRSTQRNVKNIFSDLALLFGDGQSMIEKQFLEGLSKSLNRFVQIIEETSGSPNQLQRLKEEVTVINSILKFSKSNAKQESNICDPDQFFLVVNAISKLIDRKQFESLSSSLQQTAFMLKEEFRTIMITLFILFEYNLKFIFTDLSDDNPLLQKRKSTRRQGGAQQNAQIDQNQVLMQDADEIKKEFTNTSSIITEQQSMIQETMSKDRYNLMEAIEQHLKIKIKDEKAREDTRLKVFIKFCLEHKKIINAFIRANQQVLNESLRNVLMKVPQVLDFDNKRLLFRSQIKKIQKKYRLKYFDLQVRRDKAFEDSYEQLKNTTVEKWMGSMGIEFTDEQGIDAGGLTKEWFSLLSQKIFNPDLALFLQSNAGSTYYPNPQSIVQPEYKQYFKFIGRLVAKALYEQELLDCYFVKAFYKIILGLSLTYHDVEDFDNDLYRNLKWCLENSVEGLGFAFTETRDYFGQSEEIEIIEGGKDLEVTNENKFDYVQKMAYQKLYKSIKQQVDSFLEGFYEIIPKPLIQIFDNRELELLISGLPNIDIMDLKENTHYVQYTSVTPVIKWLFEVLEEFDNSERAEFIQFVTGSSKVPVEGFKGLRGQRGPQRFQIVKFHTNDNNRLPQAHTCFKQLELPEYTSKEQLKERLLTAIKEGKTFGFA